MRNETGEPLVLMSAKYGTCVVKDGDEFPDWEHTSLNQQPPLKSATRAVWVAWAKQEGHEVPDGVTKADLIKRIEATEAQS